MQNQYKHFVKTWNADFADFADERGFFLVCRSVANAQADLKLRGLGEISPGSAV